MIYVVFNPVAGRGRGSKALPLARDLLLKAGFDHEVLVTQRPGHATCLVKSLPKDADVIVLGGDGTVHEAASACFGTGRTLGVLPVGSGDDFAFALNVNRFDLSEAVNIIHRAQIRKIDVGLVNDVPFFNAVGVGFDADVANRMRSAPRFLKGQVAYLYAAVTTLVAHQLVRVDIEVDGNLVYGGRSLLVSSHNGPRVGGSFLFAPDASPDDGMLDVVAAGYFGRLGTLGIIPRTMRGKHLSHPEVFSFRGSKVLLRWETPRFAHVDGEMMEPCKEFRIEILPKALRVYS